MATRNRIAALVCAAVAASASAAKADWDYWAVDYSGDASVGNRIFTVDSLTGIATLRSTRVFESNGWQPQNSYADTKTGELVIYNGNNGIERFNLDTNAWTKTGVGWVGNYQKVFERPTIVGNTDGTTSIGQGTAVIQIDANGNGVSTGDGESLIRVAADGALHIGENSLVTIEEGGVQKLYATDANGKPIPINVTNGTSFLIDGTNVKSTLDTHTTQINSLNATVDTHTTQINSLNTRVGNLETNMNNLGSGVAGATALSAAMTALPATSDDSPFSCGTGTGGYSNRYAMGFGCAARVTERLAFNAGGSFVFGGASNYGGGTLDNVAGRVGFVFKIGKLNPNSNHAISKRTEKLETQLSEVRQENQKIISENQQLTSYIAQMKELIAVQNKRLESLESIAKASTGHSVQAKNRSTAVQEVASIMK